MSRFTLGLLSLTLLAGATTWFAKSRASSASVEARGARPVEPQPEAPALEVRELFAPGAELKPSAKARQLAGQRVRLIGFVAEMELRPAAAVYLVPSPVHCDEAGGGSADLPPESVLVALPAGWQPPGHIAGPVEATGTFEVGNRSDQLGRVANFRLQLEAPWVGARGSAGEQNIDARARAREQKREVKP